ncbi:MAG: chromate resistance protein [Thermoplasmata archaeon]|nr:chromate resistance protein [Thermoplasmata archaeon]
MKWVTREKARVDRIACPWLIRKFIDPKAEFLYVPKERVLEVAKSEGAIPFDTPGAELHHYEEGGREFVSFDAIIRKYKLNDPALRELAQIVRVADGGSGHEPEAAGLEAAATGVRMMAKDDFENQRLQFPFYDALYEFCKWKVEQGGKLEHTGG